MGWTNLVVGAHEIHIVCKTYVNVVKTISKVFEPTSPTNIITNETILDQYSINKVLQISGKKANMKWKNNCNNFMTAQLYNQISFATSIMNSEIRDWRT